MAWITWLLFESRAALGALLLTLNFFLLVCWRRGGRPQPLFVGLGAALLLLILQAVVVTHRERAALVMTPIEHDLVAGRATTLFGVLSDDFHAGPLDAARFRAVVESSLKNVDVVELNRQSIRVTESRGGEFTASIGYWAQVVTGEISHPFRSRWRITFRPTPAGWRLTNIEPEFLDGVPNPTWDNVRAR